jgi:Mg2+ and Co2+ transporter CorA
MKSEIGDQVGKLAGYIDRLYALRNNDAVNRLAMLSMILGIGALVTGYYGINIPNKYGYNGATSTWACCLSG